MFDKIEHNITLNVVYTGTISATETISSIKEKLKAMDGWHIEDYNIEDSRLV